MTRSRKSALEFAIKMRTCPPPTLKDPVSKIREHRAACSRCSDHDPKDLEPWLKIVEQARRIIAGRPVEIEPQPGTLFWLHDRLASWEGVDYFNPPVVLVLSGEAHGTLKVAQVYFDPLLAAGDDVVLDHRDCDAGELFIQPWNCYNLVESDLQECLGRVSQRALEAVIARGRDPEARIDWLPLAWPLVPGDPRLQFRRLERKVARVFASASVRARVETMAARAGLATVHALKAAAAKLENRPHFPPEQDELTGLLTWAVPPPEQLPLAAAGSRGDVITVRYWKLSQTGIKRFETLKAEIIKSGVTGAACKLSGRIQGLPALGPGAVMLAFRGGAGQSLEHVMVSWEPASGSFLLEMAPEDCHRAARNLALAVVDFSGACC